MAQIVENGSARVNSAESIEWAHSLIEAGSFPHRIMKILLHLALFYALFLCFFLRFFQLISTNLSTKSDPSWAVGVRFGRPMAFMKAKDLTYKGLQGRQVEQPSRSHKWRWPRVVAMFCVLPSEKAADKLDKVLRCYRLT